MDLQQLEGEAYALLERPDGASVVIEGKVLDHLHAATGAKCRPVSREDHGTEVRFGVECVKGLQELMVHRAIDGVVAVRSVEGDRDHAW